MRVILISGKARSGKNAVADMIREHLGSMFVRNEFFARPLKEMCEEAWTPFTNFLNNEFGVRRVDKTIVQDRIDKYDPTYDLQLQTKSRNWWDDKNAITRQLLQITGTEIVRRVDPEYWIKQTIANIRTKFQEKHVRYVTVSDWRFINEGHVLAEEFQHTIRVRVERPNGEVLKTPEHVSETQLDDYKEFDYTIKNTGNLNDLRVVVADMCDKIVEEGLL